MHLIYLLNKILLLNNNSSNNCKMDMLTSKILFFCPSLTLPAKQQCAKAFWIICLFDFALGSLYNLGPAAKK